MKKTSPIFSIYIVWHPNFKEGQEIAEALRQHFRRNLFDNISGGVGISVLFRSTGSLECSPPLDIDFSECDSTAVVILADDFLVNDTSWSDYLIRLGEQSEKSGFASGVFPVSTSSSALANLKLEEQALRWDKWAGNNEENCKRLIYELTYEFCRLLRYLLTRLQNPTKDEDALESYLRKVQIFLSHSKHDKHGQNIALAIRDRLHSGHGLATFFDVHDIPAGIKFHKVLLHQLRVSAVVAIHTDSYSSREWCRKEIIEAKRHNVPLVVADSLSDLDERGFPYLGNVPVVRLEPEDKERMDYVIQILLDEVLRDFLWRSKTILAMASPRDGIFFIPRPPELISLASLPPRDQCPTPLIVYPDPPLSSEEERLFHEIAPHVQLRSFNEWIAGAIR
jgi:hypothetical protein